MTQLKTILSEILPLGSFGLATATSKATKAIIAGFTNLMRRTFPNVMQLFFAKNLNTSDFNKQQLLVMYRVVFKAINRTKKLIGGTEYDDYGYVDGKLIKDAWFGQGGVKTTDLILKTAAADPTFMVATTLGRFSYKVVPANTGAILHITDVYDFKKIPDANTKLESLKGYSYLGKIYKIMKDNNCGPYVAIRHLGYLEYPESGLNQKPKISIKLNISPKNWLQIQRIVNINTTKKIQSSTTST